MGALEELPGKYPLIYRAYQRPRRYPRAVIAHRGLECGEGWCAIVDEISAWLEVESVKLKATGKRCPMVRQVKEKFGGLRFYVEHLPKSLREEFAIRETKAMRQSMETCERCGETGRHYTDGWHRTLCATHEHEYQTRQQLRLNAKSTSSV